MDRYDFADGKYTVINDNGILTALRHGEPWGRDLVGDNLVYWMLVEVLRLKELCETNAKERIAATAERNQAADNAISLTFKLADVEAERDALRAAAENLVKNWDANKHMLSTAFAVGDLRALLMSPRYEEQPDGSVIPVDPSEMRAVEQRCQLCKYEHGHSIGCENNPVDIAINALSHPKTEATSTTIPHSLAGFRGAFESEHGRKPTEQEVWNAAIRSWRDLSAPTTWQDLPDNEIDRILDTHAGSAASEYGGAFGAVVEAVSEALSKRNGGVR